LLCKNVVCCVKGWSRRTGEWWIEWSSWNERHKRRRGWKRRKGCYRRVRPERWWRTSWTRWAKRCRWWCRSPWCNGWSRGDRWKGGFEYIAQCEVILFLKCLEHVKMQS